MKRNTIIALAAALLPLAGFAEEKALWEVQARLDGGKNPRLNGLLKEFFAKDGSATFIGDKAVFRIAGFENDATQEVDWVSSALDEGRKLPAAVLDHAAHCPDCAAFLDAWTGGLHETLAAPMPPAGLVLRDEILAMAAETARVETNRHRFRGYVSAAAAAVVLAICGYTLIDIQPSGTSAAARPGPAERELAAIKSDFRRGLAALLEPAGAVQRVLRP